MTEIGTSAFTNCKALTAVNISDLAAWCSIDFGSAASNPLSFAHKLYLNGAEVKDLIIPEGVTIIEAYTFTGCTGLTSVTVPEEVTGIGQNAFSGCTSLANVNLPASLTTIGKEAFKNCTGLVQIACRATQTPTVTADAFANVDVTSVTLVVPSDSEELYSKHNVWGQFLIEADIDSFAKESIETGIGSAKVDVLTSESYDLSGRRQNALQHGLNLIRMSDGSVKKVLVK